MLSFGNAAPDIFSALTAATKSEKGIYMGLAALIGSGLFSIGATLSFVSFIAGKDIIVNKAFFLRDGIYFLIGVVIIFVLMLYVEKITLWMSIGLIGIYCTYAVVVFI